MSGFLEGVGSLAWDALNGIAWLFTSAVPELVLSLSLLLGALSVVVLSLVLLERKFLGRLQMRMGPMRVGPHGLLQPVADAVKLMGKEDIMPSWVDRWVYWIAPLVFFVPSFVIWVTIPSSPSLVLRDLELGLLYVIAFSVVSIVGLIMAGWGSANKYGVLGGLRSVAQLISYEIPIIAVALTVALLAGSLNLVEIVEKQSPVPFAVLQPLGLFLFFMAGLAEVGRTPFDIYHAESELMGGPFVEYSGAHWAIFYLAEYINTFLLAALIVVLFLGGWSGPLLPPIVWFLLKTYAVVLLFFWFRGTFPRLRIDQLMALAWKVLVPLAFFNLILAAAARFYGWPDWTLAVLGLAALVALGALTYRATSGRSSRPTLRLVPAREVRRA